MLLFSWNVCQTDKRPTRQYYNNNYMAHNVCKITAVVSEHARTHDLPPFVHLNIS